MLIEFRSYDISEHTRLLLFDDEMTDKEQVSAFECLSFLLALSGESLCEVSKVLVEHTHFRVF